MSETETKALIKKIDNLERKVDVVIKTKHGLRTPLLTTNEACIYTKFGRRKLLKYASAMGAKKIGGDWFFKVELIDAFINKIFPTVDELEKQQLLN